MAQASEKGLGRFYWDVGFRSDLREENTAKILLRLAFRPFACLGARFVLFSSSTLRFCAGCRIMSSVKKPFERLPSSVLPKNYKLSLKPNLTEFTFTGEEVIDVEVKDLIARN